MVLTDNKWNGNDLGLYRSILPIISTLVTGRKIAYLGVLKYQKVSSNYKKSFRVTIEGPHLDSAKNLNVWPWASNCVVTGFQVSERNIVLEIRLNISLWVYTSILSKMSTLSPDHVIVYFGAWYYQEIGNMWKNVSGLSIQGLHVD